jgi:hypothetical protein
MNHVVARAAFIVCVALAMKWEAGASPSWRSRPS